MGKRNRVKERTLMYQDHRLTPEDFLHFKDNLTDEEKAGIRTYIKQVESWLAKHNH